MCCGARPDARSVADLVRQLNTYCPAHQPTLRALQQGSDRRVLLLNGAGAALQGGYAKFTHLGPTAATEAEHSCSLDVDQVVEGHPCPLRSLGVERVHDASDRAIGVPGIKVIGAPLRVVQHKLSGNGRLFAERAGKFRRQS